ncbi:hypothetical protein [Pseudomonas guariconensis]|uniref:hypothetical protein n=1 Tax=Pseudomonas guariconensis TaxID=1288410 RepID=UPI00390659E2
MVNPTLVDVEYHQEEDAFDTSKILADWERPANAFISASAKSAQAGSQGALPLDGFVDWLSAFALELPNHMVGALELTLERSPGGIAVQYTVISRNEGIEPPIEADNPGFVRYALTWFAERRPAIRLFVSAGLFWVEGKR